MDGTGPLRPLGDPAERLTVLLGEMPLAVLLLDSDLRTTYANPAAVRLLEHDGAVGASLADLLPGADAEDAARRCLETGSALSVEVTYPGRWYELRLVPHPDGVSLFVQDSTASRVAEARAAHTSLRARLLSEVSAQIGSTLDAQEAVLRLAHLLVPTLADWCVVSLVDGEAAPGPRNLYDAVGWHRDPELRPLVECYREERMGALLDESFIDRAVSSPEPVVIARGAADTVARVLRPGVARDLLEKLAPEAAVFLPLRGRDRTVGVLSLFRGADRGPLDIDDLAVADEVAVRAGLALDNARLFQQQQQLAEAFQRSLLTAPPEPDHMQVVVRYEPAAEAAQVGGDWYDAFLQLDGATVLVIGDVVGHDRAAAAAMGQLRSLLRGVAARTGDGPADVLRGVDLVMATLQVDTTATVVVARVEQSQNERERGVTHVRWSNAGHPPPMAINPDGSVVLLSGVGADLLLGIDPETERVESAISLDRGSTVLLYTDGLVERRGQSLDEGLARLRDTLVELAARDDLDLDGLCDAVLTRMLPAHPEDDVALVAVRLHPQDQPRPPEAGPQNVPDIVLEHDGEDGDDV